MDDFSVRGKEPKDEVQIYTWKDATLRELTDLVYSSNPSFLSIFCFCLLVYEITFYILQLLYYLLIGAFGLHRLFSTNFSVPCRSVFNWGEFRIIYEFKRDILWVI
jgi:hypothetical protein